MHRLFDLTGKNAVVTGGSRGLGKEIALGLAEAGANVAIISRKESPEVVKELEQFGVNAVSIAFDIGNIPMHKELLHLIEEKLGKLIF